MQFIQKTQTTKKLMGMIINHWKLQNTQLYKCEIFFEKFALFALSALRAYDFAATMEFCSICLSTVFSPCAKIRL